MGNYSIEKTDRMTSGRRLTKNVIWNFIGLSAPMLAAVITIPILIKGLGTARFGILTLVWMAIGYFTLFDLGLGRALTKLVSEKLNTKSSEEIPALIWTSLFIMGILGAVGALVFSSLSTWLIYDVLKIPADMKEETLNAFYLMSISIPIVISATGLRGVLEAHQRFDLTNAVRIPMGLVNFLGPLAVLPFSQSLFFVVMVLVAGRIIAWGALLILCFRVVPALRANIGMSLGLILPLLRFGGWMTVSNVISPLMVYLDRFFIGALASAVAVAYYTTPWEVVTKFLIISSAVVGVLFPTFSTSFSLDPERATRLYKQGIKYVFVILFPITLTVVVFAKDILLLWLGIEFAENSYRVMQIMMIGVLINGISAVPFAFIQGIGRPDLTAKFHLIESIIYLPCAYWLITRYGIVGASLAWIMRVSIDASFLLLFVKRYTQHQGKDFTQQVMMAFLVLAPLVLAMLSFKFPLKLVFWSFTMSVFLSYTWFALMNTEERALIIRRQRY